MTERCLNYLAKVSVNKDSIHWENRQRTRIYQKGKQTQENTLDFFGTQENLNRNNDELLPFSSNIKTEDKVLARMPEPGLRCLCQGVNWVQPTMERYSLEPSNSASLS